MNQDLARLVDVYWDLELERGPTGGLFIGHYRYADRTENVTREAEDSFILRLEALADAAEVIDPAGLTRDEWVTQGVMIEEARAAASELRSRLEKFAVDPSTRAHVTLLQLVSHLAPPNADVADAIVTKWSRLGDTFDQAAERLRQGVAGGRTPPRISVEKVLGQLDAYLTSDIATDPFTMATPPPEYSEEDAGRWRAALADQVAA